MQNITNEEGNVLDAEKELSRLLVQQILDDIRSEMDIVYKEAFGESAILRRNNSLMTCCTM